MPWPNDVVTRTVFGTYLTGLGAPAKGRITFTPTSRVVDSNDATVVEDTITVVLDQYGSFSVDLPTTDNQLLSPESWAYDVNVRLYGVKPRKFYAILPYGDGSDIDISTIVAEVSVPTVGGVTGAVGPMGPRGPGILFGNGLPNDSLGFDGDVYLNTADGSYYGPKQNGQWPDIPAYAISTTSQRYEFEQASPSSTWSITHPLGGKPSVSVVDSSGTIVIGEVSYNSNTLVTVQFTAPFSGYAYLT